MLKENYLTYANRYFKAEEQIKLPKQKLEKDYDNTIIPTIYEKLVQRNSEKINQNAKTLKNSNNR